MDIANEPDTATIVRDVAPVGLTSDRLQEIEDGVGDPATEDELAFIATWNARTAPIMEAMRPQLAEVIRVAEIYKPHVMPVDEVDAERFLSLLADERSH